MNDFDKKLDFDSNTFENMKARYEFCSAETSWKYDREAVQRRKYDN